MQIKELELHKQQVMHQSTIEVYTLHGTWWCSPTMTVVWGLEPKTSTETGRIGQYLLLWHPTSLPPKLGWQETESQCMNSVAIRLQFCTPMTSSGHYILLKVPQWVHYCTRVWLRGTRQSQVLYLPWNCACMQISPTGLLQCIQRRYTFGGIQHTICIMEIKN